MTVARETFNQFGLALTGEEVFSALTPQPLPILTPQRQRCPRITLVISSLSTGGAERVMARLADYWARKGWLVTLITLASEREDFFSVSPSVSRVSLRLEAPSRGILWGIWKNINRVTALRGAIISSRPSVVISFIDQTNILTLLATRFAQPPVIVAERTDPRHHRIGFAWSALRTCLYPRAAALVVQTQGVSDWAVQKVGANKVYVIPNAVGQTRPVSATNACPFPAPFVLAIGRLTREKGFDLLFRAFERATRHLPDWSLVVVGEGIERCALEQLSEVLGIGARVHMPGRLGDFGALMERASMFVLSSRFEGFPNALLEAMASGLPVVSFDCPSGPVEIIRDGIDGVLVPRENVVALGDAMRELIQDPGKRARLALRAPEVKERFNAERVMKMWETIVYNVWKKE